MTDSPPADDDAETNRIELASAIVLGLAALLTAIAAFKGAEAGGAAIQGYTTSTRTLNDANAFYSQANATTSLDQTLFTEYAIAFEEGNEAVADFLRQNVMRPELQEAMDWFDATEEATTPFDDLEGNPYTVEDADIATDLEDEASTQFDEAAAADEDGGRFELANVVFAISLFAAGIANVFSNRLFQRWLVFAGAVLLVGGAVILAAALAG